jgi:cell division protein FtsL
MSSRIRKFKETVDIRSLALKRLRSHRYFPIAMIILALMAVACLHIWQRVHVIKLVKDVGELREENREIIDCLAKSRNEIAALSMASRIQAYATDSLGLEVATADQLFTLMRTHDVKRPQDEFAEIVSSIERVAKYLPVLTENGANAAELQPIKFDSAYEGSDPE